MKARFVYALILGTGLAQAQATQNTTAAPSSKPLNISDFGLVYPLSDDWIGATTMMRRTVAAQDSSPRRHVLQAAVYIPKSSSALSHPFFTLFALEHSGGDCNRYLEAVRSDMKQEKRAKIDHGIEQFSAAGYNYYRMDFGTSEWIAHRSVICTTAKNDLLIWSVGSPDRKGVEQVVSTLNSIKSAMPEELAGSQIDAAAWDAPQKKIEPNSVHVASGVTQGLKIKGDRPEYPAEARQARIQGTVVLNGTITKEGDLKIHEVISGPIELVGSAVDAVRTWKYRPYLLEGKPVEVMTEIQVNYTLGGR